MHIHSSGAAGYRHAVRRQSGHVLPARCQSSCCHLSGSRESFCSHREPGSPCDRIRLIPLSEDGMHLPFPGRFATFLLLLQH
ncbi:hypothetical protein PBY51_009221 [Eleginops maclovinus]|uniref:Uncharacterized protein n=1 Tax=Eleginops maclovinus TaxID=56733 RepID=A0AAN8ATL2_ELEMC|nr:hypothetical protein PBY51_009221 [Eleginops maclovinus]